MRRRDGSGARSLVRCFAHLSSKNGGPEGRGHDGGLPTAEQHVRLPRARGCVTPRINEIKSGSRTHRCALAQPRPRGSRPAGQQRQQPCRSCTRSWRAARTCSASTPRSRATSPRWRWSAWPSARPPTPSLPTTRTSTPSTSSSSTATVRGHAARFARRSQLPPPPRPHTLPPPPRSLPVRGGRGVRPPNPVRLPGEGEGRLHQKLRRDGAQRGGNVAQPRLRVRTVVAPCRRSRRRLHRKRPEGAHRPSPRRARFNPRQQLPLPPFSPRRSLPGRS